MGDVAEGVLVLVQLAVLRQVDPPVDVTYWPSWLRGVLRSTCVTLVGGVS